MYCGPGIRQNSGPPLPTRVRIAGFDASGVPTGVVEVDVIRKTDSEWMKQLPADSYSVTRQKDTEFAGTGAYDRFYERRNLSLHLLRHGGIRLESEVRFRYRMAQFHRADCQRECSGSADRLLRHPRDGGQVRPMRRASGACVRRWPTAGRTCGTASIPWRCGSSPAQPLETIQQAAVDRRGVRAHGFSAFENSRVQRIDQQISFRRKHHRGDKQRGGFLLRTHLSPAWRA